MGSDGHPASTHVDVLRVVEFGVLGVEDGVDDPGLQIQEDSSGYVVVN